MAFIDALARWNMVAHFGLGPREQFDEFGDVGADDEIVLGAGHEYAAHVRLCGDCLRGLAQLAHGELIQLIDRGSFPIEAQFNEAVRDAPGAHCFALIHSRPSMPQELRMQAPATGGRIALFYQPVS